MYLVEGDVVVVEVPRSNFGIVPQARDLTCYRAGYGSRRREEKFPYCGAE